VDVTLCRFMYYCLVLKFMKIIILNCTLYSLGVALLFMHIASTLFKDDLPKKKEYLDKALEILEFGEHNLTGRRCTFLCGDVGMVHLQYGVHFC